jgi:integrase
MGEEITSLVPVASRSAVAGDTPYIYAPSQPTLFAEEVEAARAYAKASRAPSTQRVYASDWTIFTAWCAERDALPLPADPALVAVFLAAEAASGVAPSTIGRRLAAIAAYHLDANLTPPQERDGSIAIKKVVAGIRRTHGTAPKRKLAADADILRDMLRAIDGDDLRSIRDRAVLAIGMAGALRRSELVALDVDDVELVPTGLRITIVRSKTDQEGAGSVIAVPEDRRIKPKELLIAWVAAARIKTGPLFLSLSSAGRILGTRMSDKGVARVVKARAEAAGLDMDDFSGHSLRSGFITEAARQGATVFKIREVSRHKSVQVLSDYVREAELFRDHAGDKFL